MNTTERDISWTKRRYAHQSRFHLRITAYHEAAHAVVHLLQGQRVYCVTVDPWEVQRQHTICGDVGTAEGVTHISFQDKFCSIVSLYAPYAWEMQEDRISSQRNRKAVYDFKMIRAFAVSMTDEAMSDYKPGDPEWNGCFFRVLMSARRRARDLIREPIIGGAGGMVRFIAMKLEEQGTLSESQLIDLLSAIRFYRDRSTQTE